MEARVISLSSVQTSDFDEFKSRKQTQKSFREFVIEYLSSSKRSDKYKAMYLQAYNLLEEYASEERISLFTHNINEEVGEGFVHFLRDRGLMLSTVKSTMAKITALLNKADRRGYSVDRTFSDAEVKDEECESVYLSMIEITRIYYYQGLKRKEEWVRDYFIIGCLTGLRFSDYSRIGRQNFHDDIIVIKTKKTGSTVKIPVHPFVREIMEKYNWKLPKPHTIQAFNRQIKAICHKIGLEASVAYNRTHGYDIVSKEMKKWEMISSHTARRSCATNMYKQGIPTWMIMAITGHKTERAFFRYIRITQDEAISQLKGSNFYRI